VTQKFSSTLQRLADLWSRNMATVIEQTSGATCPVSVDGEIAPEKGSILFQVSFRGGLSGVMEVSLPTTSVVVLSQLFLGEPVDQAAERTADVMDAVLELVRQTAGAAASELKAEFGDISTDANEVSQAVPAHASIRLQAFSPQGQVPFVLSLDRSLMQAFEDAAPATAAPVQSASQSVRQSGGVQNLDMIMDLELNVKLRFGSKQLRLSDVLDLDSGAVVELDRMVDEPVELLLAERVVAKGEVVIVDGHYGLRVTEVLANGVGASFAMR
jgi:flagellar motor switch protein FliN